MRNTFRAWRSTSTSPMYTTHSRPKSAHAVAAATSDSGRKPPPTSPKRPSGDGSAISASLTGPPSAAAVTGRAGSPVSCAPPLRFGARSRLLLLPVVGRLLDRLVGGLHGGEGRLGRGHAGAQPPGGLSSVARLDRGGPG